jgi:protein required for attachment to host cells
MNKVIIVADLGHFKAFKVSKEMMESSRIEMIQDYDILETHGKVSEKLSNGSGTFGLGGGKQGIRGYGECHNMETENCKRVIKKLAENINKIINREDCKQWNLAAGRKINGKIMENLDKSVKARLTKNISSDLTKAKKAEILARFDSP